MAREHASLAAGVRASSEAVSFRRYSELLDEAVGALS
jgi:hypothetical protein